jgi:hypothetical protein
VVPPAFLAGGLAIILGTLAIKSFHSDILPSPATQHVITGKLFANRNCA